MCGILGIMSKACIADLIYHGMIQLQHRGQDAAGIFAYDPDSGKIYLHKEKGLVKQVFNPKHTNLPQTRWGIGHVRYVTIGAGSVEDTQPHCMTKNYTIAMAHNGNILNYVSLKKNLETDQVKITTSCDVEVILNIFSQHLPEKEITFEDICHAVNQIYKQVSGAYSVIVMISGVGMVAFRDPKGIRPLLYGTKKEGEEHAFASETEALSFLGFQNIHSVQPGEAVFIDHTYQSHRRVLTEQTRAHCSFEYVYFSMANTIIDDREVYSVRYQLGLELAKKIRASGIEADVALSVPETSRPAALAIAKELGIDYHEGLVKKDHVGRTFIMPSQKKREAALSRKLATVPSVFKDKNVLIVDDSIVRGTVSRKVVRLARQAGAKKIYFVATFPPIRHPCFYGIDFHTQEELLAWERSVDEIAEEINADGVIYNDLNDLKHAIQLEGLCTACITGDYPTETKGIQEFQQLRKMHRELQKETV